MQYQIKKQIKMLSLFFLPFVLLFIGIYLHHIFTSKNIKISYPTASFSSNQTLNIDDIIKAFKINHLTIEKIKTSQLSSIDKGMKYYSITNIKPQNSFELELFSNEADMNTVLKKVADLAYSNYTNGSSLRFDYYHNVLFCYTAPSPIKEEWINNVISTLKK